MGKGEIEDFALLDEMVSSSCQWLVERLNPKRVAGMVDVDAFITLRAQKNTLLLGL